MGTQTKPLKRDVNLQTFSHEHHHGLVFCTRLKKAEKTDLDTFQHFVVDFWNSHLKSHFKAEEALLMSLISDANLCNQLQEEHKEIQLGIQSIFKCNINNYVLLAHNLATLINNHIRFEERQLFPHLEKTLSVRELTKIGDSLAHSEIISHSFEPQFWKS